MIQVKFDTKSFRRGLDAARRKQIPFAMSRALKNTALKAQHRIQRNLPDEFILRRQHIRKGIRVTYPTKQTLRAVVGSIDQFMALQAEGGTKKGQGKGLYAFYPTKIIQPSLRSLVPRRKFPQKLTAKKTLKRAPFITRFPKSGNLEFRSQASWSESLSIRRVMGLCHEIVKSKRSGILKNKSTSCGQSGGTTNSWCVGLRTSELKRALDYGLVSLFPVLLTMLKKSRP